MEGRYVTYLLAVVILLCIAGIVYLLRAQSPPACGIENCHGLDIKCGSDVAEVCDASYQLGDKCRDYASCEITSGKCQLVKRNGFDECKSCIEGCNSQFFGEPERTFVCENRCMG